MEYYGNTMSAAGATVGRNNDTVIDLDTTIRSVQQDPGAYLNLIDDTNRLILKRHPKVISAALLEASKSNDSALQQRIVDHVFLVMLHPPTPEDNNDLKLCRDVIQTENADFIQMYMQKAVPHIVDYVHQVRHIVDFETEEVPDFLDCYLVVFRALPTEIRRDPVMLQVALYNVRNLRDFEMVLRDSDPALFLENLLFIRDVLTSYLPSSFWHVVPPEFLHNRELVSELLVFHFNVPSSMFPNELRSDRRFFVDFFARSGQSRPGSWETNFSKMISDTLKSDKEFVLKCVRHHPFMLFHCAKTLRADLDVLSQAAQALCDNCDWLDYFIVSDPDRRLPAFVHALQIKIYGNDFKTFLACCWKSCRLHDVEEEEPERDNNYPLRLLDNHCGPDIKRFIRSFVVDKEAKEIGRDMKRYLGRCLERMNSAALGHVELPHSSNNNISLDHLVYAKSEKDLKVVRGVDGVLRLKAKPSRNMKRRKRQRSKY